MLTSLLSSMSVDPSKHASNTTATALLITSIEDKALPDAQSITFSGIADGGRSSASSTTGVDSMITAELPSETLRKSSRRKAPPSRSVSPASQSAGVLFRVSPQTIESICIGNFESSSSLAHSAISSGTASLAGETIGTPSARGSELMTLAGEAVPPLDDANDYGFALAAAEYAKRAMHDGESLSSPEDNDGEAPQSGSLRPRSSRVMMSSGRASSYFADEDDEEQQFPTPRQAPVHSKPRPRRPVGSLPRKCISCDATKTPYWREAWSPSVLLCNACGLRYSKFRRRCLNCSYVPRKEDKTSRVCPKCDGPWS